MEKPEKILVFCTVTTGIDTVAEMLRRSLPVVGLVGLHPDKGDPIAVSGWFDIATFAKRWNVPYYYARSYDLKQPEDRRMVEGIDFDLALISGWQRLVPRWLIDRCRFGALGGHGSPDGIQGGRGRSPQNWALLLNCRRFDLSLFRVTEGIDDGPIVATRSFFYMTGDDIAVSHYRASLAMTEMITEVLSNPEKLSSGTPQPQTGYYYPQRRPDDGWVDWSLSRETIASHCRALTHPYPGLKTRHKDVEISLWQCHPFDDIVEGSSGTVSACFESGDFLVSCLDGRVLVREWTASDPSWRPEPFSRLIGKPWGQQLNIIIDRHENRYPELEVSPRIKRMVKP